MAFKSPPEPGTTSAALMNRKSYSRQAVVWVGALVIMGVVETAPAVVLGLQDANSSVAIDINTQHGLFDWKVDGVNFAPTAGGGINDYRQWFWYRIGPTP